jgi:predicted metal-dependent hydrolase
MAYREYIIDEIGTVSVHKRKSSKHIRMSIRHNGQIQVSIPRWAPYITGLTFAKSKVDWLTKNKRPAVLLKDGSVIGRSHRLKIVNNESSKSIRTRVGTNDITVSLPAHTSFKDKTVQEKTTQACIKALKKQSDEMISGRLQFLSNKHNLPYKELKIKNLKKRWGSCDSNKNISISCFLVQLPDDLMDYVLLHELVHTQNMSHNSDFWQTLEKLCPNMKNIKKEIKTYQPTILPKEF